VDSLLIEAPEQTVVVVEPTPEQLVIMRMIEMVKEGKWCRNSVDDRGGHHCVLGMIGVSMNRGPFYTGDGDG
jgi:hypothetical protein